MRLTHIPWPKAQAYFKKRDIALLAVGSIENHGRHLALGTDTLIPEKLLDLIEEKSDVLICPTIPYGATEYFADVPGSLDLGSELLYQVLLKLCTNLYNHGIRHFVILNGHGGNNKSIERVGYKLERKGALLAELNWWLMAWDLDPSWKGGHGGGEETAAMMGIDPGLVDEEMLEYPNTLKDITPEIKANGLSTAVYKGVQVVIPRLSIHVTDNGWYGPDHPSTATEKWGKEMLYKTADYIADFMKEFEKAELPKPLK
ncbi:MAG: creatininase family protein [Erysipelotrichaceae bacterium]|jgi:creatinine amidohydrolase|nr:creatininase family protein [Erysipelotrichaceae bacterium]